MSDNDALVFNLSESLNARFAKFEEELVELYKRCDLLLQVDEQAENTVNKMLAVLQELQQKVDKMEITLEHMKH